MFGSRKKKQSGLKHVQLNQNQIMHYSSGTATFKRSEDGATVLLRSVKTETIVALLRGVGGGGSPTGAEGVGNSVSIDDRDPKLSQLKELAVWIGRNDVKLKSSKIVSCLFCGTHSSI